MTDILDGLDPEQLRAATAPRGPVAIIAGAGTGKTRTITHRIAHLVEGGYVNPDRVLAVTFTNRAAAELRERLARMNVPRVQARTFHAAAMRQLKYFWPRYAAGVEWEFLNTKFPLVARAARSQHVDTNKTMLADLLGEIEWAKSSLVVPEDYPHVMDANRRDCPVDADKFVKIFQAYEQLKTSGERFLLDFDDLLLHMAAALETNAGIAEEFRSQYRTFVVDEYQDVTPLQQRVLDAWLGERDDLTVVGDANQTIYSFNGATPEYLLDFTRKFPEATTVRLQRDYRSTPQVVDLANKVIEQAKGRIAGSRLQLVGQRPAGPEPEFQEYPDEAAEAQAVAEKIRDLINAGVPTSEIAILYRINAQSVLFENALTDLGISYQVKNGEGFFQRREVGEGMQALFRAAERFDPQPGEVYDAALAALHLVGLTTNEPSGAQERERWQSLRALADLIGEMVEDNPELSLRAIMIMLRERAESKNPPRVAGVTLASIHSAKGLEWDAVFLVGLVEGTLPFHLALKGAGSAQAIEEERRLMYVGITRAREHLNLSWSQARKEGGRANRRRTRFLDGLVPTSEADATTLDSQPAGKGAPKHACAVCGARLSTPEFKIIGRCGVHAPENDHVLVAELRQWRLDTAKQRGVPPYVVITDATLKAIVAAQPTSLQQLVRVPGIGPVKAEQFGEDIVALIANYT